MSKRKNTPTKLTSGDRVRHITSGCEGTVVRPTPGGTNGKTGRYQVRKAPRLGLGWLVHDKPPSFRATGGTRLDFPHPQTEYCQMDGVEAAFALLEPAVVYAPKPARCVTTGRAYHFLIAGLHVTSAVDGTVVQARCRRSLRRA